MTPESHFLFPPFHLDLVNQQLWRGAQLVRLRPKAFAVLRYLVTHAQRLVTQEELLRAVWSDTVVSEGLLRTYIRELRAALEDEAQSPRFIETVHGRGYRFIGQVVSSQYPVASSPSLSVPSEKLTTDNWQLTTNLVGRETELTQLHGWLEKALRGERQVVFVTGEPGIGKTAVVEAFLQSLAAEQVQSPRSKVQFLTQSRIPNP